MPSYTVKAGESWMSIAGEQLGDQRQYLRLMEANSGTTVLHPGSVINIPDVSGLGTPKIPEPLWKASTAKGGNPRGYNITGMSGYVSPDTGLPVGMPGAPVTLEQATAAASKMEPVGSYAGDPRSLTVEAGAYGAGAANYPGMQTEIPSVDLTTKVPEERDLAWYHKFMSENAAKNQKLAEKLGVEPPPQGRPSAPGAPQHPGPTNESIYNYRWFDGEKIGTTLVNAANVWEWNRRNYALGFWQDPRSKGWYFGQNRTPSYEFPFYDRLRQDIYDRFHPEPEDDLNTVGGRGAGPEGVMPGVRSTVNRQDMYTALDYYTRQYGGSVYDNAGYDIYTFGEEGLRDNIDSAYDAVLKDMIDKGFFTAAGLPDEEGYLKTLSPFEVEMYHRITEMYMAEGGDSVLTSTAPDPVLGGWYGGYGDPYLWPSYGGYGGGYGGGNTYGMFVQSPGLTRWDYA